MLQSLQKIFLTNQIEVDNSGKTIEVHSHTPKQQGIFLQKIFDIVKPLTTLEVGLAYGISALFILEMHSLYDKSSERKHIIIEPDDSWGSAAIHNIKKEGLDNLVEIHKHFSDQILPRLFYSGQRIQYAYIDTTKRFEVVMHDYYFINKMLDIGGVIIFDDTGGSWPGVQRVARYLSILPHYELLEAFGVVKYSVKRKIISKVLSFFLHNLPFLGKVYATFNFKTDEEMGLNYRCLAFRKIAEDSLSWSWDTGF